MSWKPISTLPDGERAILFLPHGEKGNGEITTGMIFRDDDGTVTHFWTWGGPNSGSDIDEAPTHWMPLPDFPQ